MMEIPDSIYDSIDLLIDIPTANKDAVIDQIRFIQDEINALLIEQKRFYTEEQIAELFYLLGYVYYLHPDRINDKSVFQKIEKFLATAVQLDEKHSMARLYLGYNAYDSKNYNLAKERFKLISRDAIDPYFYLKLIEIALCCSIRIQGLMNCLEDLDSFVKEVEQYPIEDIYPHSLAKTIEGCKHSLIVSQNSRLIQLMERLDNAGGFVNWFSGLVL